MKLLTTATCAAFFLTALAHAQSPDEYDDGIAAGQLGTALYNLTNPNRPLPMPASDVLQRPASAPNSTGSAAHPVADVDRKKTKPYAQ